jgi:hypothetical protein
MRARIVTTLGVLSLAALLTQIVAAPSFAASQSTQTEQVMHQKLEHSGQLLAALVTGDWARLERHGQALQEVTTQPGWDVLRLPEFSKYTNAFQHATEALVTAADERDQRRALAAYNGLVTSCVECHRYVARARIAEGR